jgi:hypothetical protein
VLTCLDCGRDLNVRAYFQIRCSHCTKTIDFSDCSYHISADVGYLVSCTGDWFVLGPLLFILFVTPLSTFTSNSSADHHLYSNDTRLFLSFAAADFVYNISHLEHTISYVYCWMSSNFLSRNPSKTEFLLVVFLNNSQNSVILSLIYLLMSLFHLFNSLVIQHSSLIAVTLFLNTILPFLNHAFVIFMTSDTFDIVHTIDHITASSIATSLIHSKLDYCNSLLLNLPSTQTKHLQLVLNAAAHAVT